MVYYTSKGCYGDQDKHPIQSENDNTTNIDIHSVGLVEQSMARLIISPEVLHVLPLRQLSQHTLALCVHVFQLPPAPSHC